MHIGLVQIVVEPIVEKGVNSPIFMALRGKHLRKYKTSILAMTQTKIYNRPIVFECFPGFYVDLACAKAPEALRLDVYVQGDEFIDFKNFVAMYGVTLGSFLQISTQDF